ncbi:DUF397 domain-containing protein [Saccharothrix violaceirubra]|uniref:DUF397 domain-containing protein n=1 Tax=Saccharothrix violaceirubra TaxID=413306 RepID=A0A7W7T5Q4_9PSEU|nr:DUF397 domain-containing protein [Saccharothrix violaceirubra]MBB4967072.1 hypothetical protein [Saccharothrix violaceirubra]
MALTWKKSSHSGGNGGQCVELAWKKASYSAGNGGACVELAWHKSSHSGGNGGDCVEVAQGAAQLLVRDSKNPGGPVLGFTAATFAGFLSALKSD